MLNSTMDGHGRVRKLHGLGHRKARLTLCKVVGVAALFALAACKPSGTARTADTASVPPLRPVNLVVVTIDTLRADRLHCYGNKDIETPTLDALAARGVLF